MRLVRNKKIDFTIKNTILDAFTAVPFFNICDLPFGVSIFLF